jgi:cytochrome c-type biogenesis protein CcmH
MPERRTEMNRRFVTVLGLLVLGSLLLALPLALPGIASAQGGEQATPAPTREVTADEVNAISSELYCPVCENIPLDVCGTEACARWREQVRTLLEDGASQDEVINYFVTQFGERVVGTPQDPFLNLMSWAVPIVGVALGVVVAGLVFVRWRAGSRTLTAAELRRARREAESGTDDDDYRERLERELRNLK